MVVVSWVVVVAGLIPRRSIFGSSDFDSDTGWFAVDRSHWQHAKASQAPYKNASPDLCGLRMQAFRLWLD